MSIKQRAMEQDVVSDQIASTWTDEQVDIWAKDNFRLQGHGNPARDYQDALVIVYHKWKAAQRKLRRVNP